MQVNKVFDKMWDLFDEEDKESLLQWVEGMIKKHPANVDYHYVYLEVLSGINYDNIRDQKEPDVIALCTAIIRAKDAHDDLTVAKAYAYRGEMKYYAVDRRKDLDKAKAILSKLDAKNAEVKFISQLIDAAYPLHIRQYLELERSAFRL